MNARRRRRQPVRAQRDTRQLLLTVAEEMFGRKGYLEATVDDIIRRAGVSRGTFYVYFQNKDDIFRALVTTVVNELFSVSRAPNEETGLRARIVTGNRRYLEVFARHRRLLRSMFQVGTFDPRIAAVHRDIRRTFIRRTQRHLEKGRQRGVVRPVNLQIAAWAVSLMVEWFAYLWLGTSELPQHAPFDMESVVDTLSDLWCHALYEPRAIAR
jgi:AcrR family transcriptional regulator